ncbi:IclR family transcriptional regulator [Rhodococcus erythropolis]|uniref:hypothetical protein n=1 Tax=Rhodococcus erythropolis TaxID=1833 RepID=UPI0022280AF5|nr:hypothetical protein [Rhodococcus erythropolis]MCW2295506.1 hypothetical protein [Rhodococcus erythropolis]
MSEFRAATKEMVVMPSLSADLAEIQILEELRRSPDRVECVELHRAPPRYQEESAQKLGCAAAAITDPDGTAIATLSVSGRAETVETTNFVAAVATSANAVSREAARRHWRSS